MSEMKCKNCVYYMLLTVATLLVILGFVMLARTFTLYNDLFLVRQDRQLQDMAQAADENMAFQLSNIQQDLDYVVVRRGFAEAETWWAETGETEKLLLRMQENLVAYNPLIHAVLAVKDGEVFLSSNNEETEYYFMEVGHERLQPCFAGDGTPYLAIITHTERASYIALVDINIWYRQLSGAFSDDGISLMLLGTHGKLLMHRWMGQNYITEAEKLTEENGDVQGMNKMLESLASGKALTASYQLSYPGENDVHAMRITVRPLQESINGYFVVALTSDYDEVIRPMQNTAIRLIAYGCMVVVGVLLCGFLALQMFRRSRHRDRELQKLILKNEQTRQLLEKTQALAHHQRLETIGTLASSIAHEFNNLLTPIMGYAILTLEGLPEEADDLAENITEIYEASRKAKTIVNRLGELSRKNAEQTFRRLQLEALCIKAIQVAAPALPAHVNTILKCEEDCCVMGNEVQLSQLLLNLILNAYHAMEEHGGTLTLHIAREADKAVLTVADTGIGISKEVLPKIFDPFFTTKGSGKGTGLGLAIARQVAEGHQGQISVTSQEGEGTVFTIFLPLAETALPENS